MTIGCSTADAFLELKKTRDTSPQCQHRHSHRRSPEDHATVESRLAEAAMTTLSACLRLPASSRMSFRSFKWPTITSSMVSRNLFPDANNGLLVWHGKPTRCSATTMCCALC